MTVGFSLYLLLWGLPYNVKHAGATDVVFWCRINKIELKKRNGIIKDRSEKI